MEAKVKDNAIVIQLDKKAVANIKFHIEGNRMHLDSTYTPSSTEEGGLGANLFRSQ